MSGDAEIPPTYYFSGITFNPSFYQSSSSDYLTLATAKSSFLTYPTAQGTETITTLISSSIDSVSTSNDLNLALSQIGGVFTLANGARTGNINIGANATAGNINFGSNTNGETRVSGTVVDIGYKQATGNIIIGGDQTSGTINIGVKAGRLATGAINICSTNQTNSLVIPITIGNSSSTTAMNGICTFATSLNTPTINPLANTSNLSICLSQSSGILNLGVGNRTKSNGTGEGNINIGTGINTITSGSVAPTINIGNNTSTANLTEISIGATNTTTTINGDLTLAGATTANDGLTLASSKYITTTASASAITAPTLITQVGYIATGTSLTTTVPTSGLVTSMASIVLTAGVWVISATRRVDNTSGTTGITISLGTNSRTNSSGISDDYIYGLSSYTPQSTGFNFASVTGIVSLTATGNITIYLNLNLTYTTPTPTSPIGNAIFSAVRIA